MMSQTATVTIPTTKSATPNLFELKTVKWLSSSYPVNQTVKVAANRYESAKTLPLFRSIFLLIEKIILSIFLFINQLPWPDWFMNILHRFDIMVENALEKVSNTIDWWFDCISVIWMRFKEFVVSMLELALAIGYFVLTSIKAFWMWTLGLLSQVIQIVLSPIFWIIGFIGDHLNQEKDKAAVKSPSQEGEKMEASNSNGIPDKTTFPRRKNAEDDYHSTASSEYESDVSVVSETRSIGHTDKLGKSYNKIEINVTAEGRLREAMHKRVKTQLTLMRKNSIHFSNGMASYVRQMLTPKLHPLAKSAYDRVIFLAEKLRLLELYALIEREISRRPLLAQIVSLYTTLLLTPIAIFSGIFGKRKSKRTRSVRSESLRRRLRTQERSPNELSPSALRQSAEPVLNNDDNNRYEMPTNKPKVNSDHEDDSSPARDSALASSIDDLPSSDSGDGTSNLTDQVIQEEVEVELSADKENFAIHSNLDSQTEDNPAIRQRIRIIDENGDVEDIHIKPDAQFNTTAVQSTDERNYAKALSTESSTTSKADSKDVPTTASTKNSRRKSSPGFKRKYNSIIPKEED